MSKKIVAKKIKGTEVKVTAVSLSHGQAILAKFDVVGSASNGSTEFVLARIREKCDLSGSTDACLCVASAADVNRSVDASIFFWDNRFWMLAVDKLGVSYYRDKAYALYEVELSNPEIMESLGGIVG